MLGGCEAVLHLADCHTWEIDVAGYWAPTALLTHLFGTYFNRSSARNETAPYKYSKISLFYHLATSR